MKAVGAYLLVSVLVTLARNPGLTGVMMRRLLRVEKVSQLNHILSSLVCLTDVNIPLSILKKNAVAFSSPFGRTTLNEFDSFLVVHCCLVPAPGVVAAVEPATKERTV
jgi:hypothetical protein